MISSSIPHTAKIIAVQRLVIILLLELLSNHFLYPIRLSLTIFPVALFLFLRKYCSFLEGVLLLICILSVYDPVMDSGAFLCISTATAFYIGNLFDFDKAAALTFWCTQNFFYLCFNREFIPSVLIANGLLHIVIIVCFNLNVLPKKDFGKETIFL